MDALASIVNYLSSMFWTNREQTPAQFRVWKHVSLIELHVPRILYIYIYIYIYSYVISRMCGVPSPRTGLNTFCKHFHTVKHRHFFHFWSLLDNVERKSVDFALWNIALWKSSQSESFSFSDFALFMIDRGHLIWGPDFASAHCRAYLFAIVAVQLVLSLLRESELTQLLYWRFTLDRSLPQQQGSRHCPAKRLRSPVWNCPWCVKKGGGLTYVQHHPTPNCWLCLDRLPSTCNQKTHLVALMWSFVGRGH